MTAVTVHGDFGAQENEICHCFYFFPIYLPWSDGTGCQDISFFNVDFQVSLFMFLFHLIKRLFSSSLLSAIRMASSACLRLLIFLPAILIPASDSSSPAFHMRCSPQKLNKQGDNIQPCHAPFSVWNQSVVPCPVASNCCFLTHI